MSDKPLTDEVSANDIRQSATLLNSRIVATPMIPAPSLSEVLSCSLHLKLENLQYTSSFKARGATHAEEIVNAIRRRGFSVALMDEHST